MCIGPCRLAAHALSELLVYSIKRIKPHPPCLLQFVGRLGSGPRIVGRIGSVVLVSISFQQKYPPGSVPRCPTAAENGVMAKGVVSGGRGLTSVFGV